MPPTTSALSAGPWKKPDMEQIPVISLNLSGLEKQPRLQDHAAVWLMKGLYGTGLRRYFHALSVPDASLRESKQVPPMPCMQKWEDICQDFLVCPEALPVTGSSRSCAATSSTISTACPSHDDEEAQGRCGRRDSGQIPARCQQPSGRPSGSRGC